MTEIDLRCKKCGRWLGKTNTAISDLVIKCGNCKHNNVFNVEFQSNFVYHEIRRVDRSSDAKGQSKTADDTNGDRLRQSNE